jgi:hypothetical protein
MLDYSDVEKIQTIKLNHLPNVNSLLKISLGLIFFTILSTALVYAETIPVDVDGTSFNVEYTATGMTVSGIESDTDFISLILTVDVTESSGTLDITLDRSLLDSTFQGLDDDFILLADGDEPVFSEITTPQSRTLSIELPAGTEEIEIIGSVFGNSASVDVISDVDDDADKAAADKAAADKTTPTQCGPGTILKNGACVLDERCGPGTILKDGACVIDPTQSSGSTSKGMTKESLMGFVIAFVVAGIIAVVFGIIAKASKSS